ncbi:uncharacterized protein LOC134821258 [Bolinopsis microptera]|uniref:uncharacterized protein LOC134821258 n=1 Tax=Bolinopsis microptera TaxID=2820187 RepID=UPI003079A20E
MRCTIILAVLVSLAYSTCFFNGEMCDQKYGCSYGCYNQKCWKQCNRHPGNLWTKPETHCSDRYSWKKEWCFIKGKDGPRKKSRVSCFENEDCKDYGATPPCGSYCIGM